MTEMVYFVVSVRREGGTIYEFGQDKGKTTPLFVIDKKDLNNSEKVRDVISRQAYTVVETTLMDSTFEDNFGNFHDKYHILVEHREGYCSLHEFCGAMASVYCPECEQSLCVDHDRKTHRLPKKIDHVRISKF